MVLRCPGQRRVTKHHPIWAQLGRNWAVGCVCQSCRQRSNVIPIRFAFHQTIVAPREREVIFAKFATAWATTCSDIVLRTSGPESNPYSAPIKDLKTEIKAARWNRSGPVKKRPTEPESRL